MPFHPTDHGRTGGEGQQPADQSLQLLDERRWRVGEDRVQTGQSGQLDALVGTRQGLQQERQELDSSDQKKEKQTFNMDAGELKRRENGS